MLCGTSVCDLFELQHVTQANDKTGQIRCRAKKLRRRCHDPYVSARFQWFFVIVQPKKTNCPLCISLRLLLPYYIILPYSVITLAILLMGSYAKAAKHLFNSLFQSQDKYQKSLFLYQ